MAKVTFEIGGVKHSLYFGMAAIRVYREKSILEVKRLSELSPKTPLDKLIVDEVKAFAYTIHAGLCNQADIDEVNRPTFAESYEIADSILYEEDKSIQQRIFDTFNESRATKAMREELSGIEKKSAPEAVKSKKKTGKG